MVCLAGLMSLVGCASSGEQDAREALSRTEVRLSLLPEPGSLGPPAVQAASTSTADELAEARTLETGTLSAYQAYAFAHSPGLRASFERWRASVVSIAGQRSLPDPVVSYAGFVAAVQTRGGPMRHKLGVRQWFPWPTSVTGRVAASTQAAEASQRVFEAHALSLGAEVARQFWALWRIEESRRIAVEQAQILDSMQRTAQTAVEVGRADVSVAAQVALQVARLEDRVRDLEEDRRRAEASLRRVIGAPYTVTVAVAQVPETAALPGVARDAIWERVRNHPRVDAMRARAQAEVERGRAARGDRAPRLAVGVEWTEIGPGDLTTSIAGDDAVAISAAVSVPIWAQGAAARERAANARARAHDAEAIRIELDLVERLETLLTDIDASARKIALYEGEMIGQAEAAAASARHAFEVGRASVAELLTAQRAVLEVQLGLVGARHDHAVAWSSLNALAGAPVERSMIGDR